MSYRHFIIFAVFAWNIIVFSLYGIDKSKARKRKRRISERTLLLTAFFMGGFGGFLGMQMFRHKTKHLEFKILLPLFAIINIAAVVAAYYFLV